MADFISTTTGQWADGATWGNTSPGTIGTDYPGLDNDTATISNGDIVTFSIDNSSYQLGDVTIDAGGELVFDNAATTYMGIGDANLIVNGDLTINVVDSAYTCTIVINSTVYTNGLEIGSAATVNISGDPSVFGSTPEAVLQANWTSGQSFTVVGDYVGVWSSGNELLLVKDGEYSAIATDCVLVTINTVAANGDNTDITINEAFPGGSYALGGYVWNIERNVIIDLNGTEDITIDGGSSTSGRLIASEGATITINSARIGWGNSIDLFDADIDNSVFHNFDGRDSNLVDCQGNDNCLMYFGSDNFYIKRSDLIRANFIGCESVLGVARSMLKACRVVNCNGLTFSSNDLIYSVLDLELYKFVGTSSIAPFNFPDIVETTITGHFGENANGVSYLSNDYIFTHLNKYNRFIRFKDFNCPISIQAQGNYNGATYGPNQVYLEAWNGDRDDYRMFGSHGNALAVEANGSGVTPYQRSGGNSVLWRVSTYSELANNKDFMMRVPIEFNYLIPSAGSYTFNIYMQTNLSAGCGYVLIMGHNSNSHYVDGSITLRASQTDWSQYATVSQAFTADGWVNLKLFIYDYTNTSYIWVDPLVEVS